MQTWTEKINLGNGITCYRGVIKKEFDLINRLESTLGSVAGYEELSSEGKRYHWFPAYVGYQQLIPEYRDCADFKFKKTDIEEDKSEESKFGDIFALAKSIEKLEGKLTPVFEEEDE